MREGNPKNIKTWEDLLKPGIEVLTPNPFSSGAAKWNLLAGYGHASDGGKNPEAGLDYVRELITEHVKVQDKSGREALQNFIGGNGDVLLSYEYEAITANKNGEKLEYVIPDDTIKINIDIATTKDAPAAGEVVPRLRPLRARPGEVRRVGLPAGQRGRPRGQQGQVPRPARPVHDRGPRRLGQGQRRPVRHRGRRDREDRGGRGSVDRQVSTLALHLRGRPAGRPGALGLGVSTLWLSLIVLLPLAAVVVRSTEGGFDAFWSAISSRQAVSALRFTLLVSLAATVINAVHRHADRVGPGARPVPRQARRQRADRPAVRAADDRRRAHAAGALRPDQPGRHRRRVHAVRRPARAAVRDAAVRDPRRCSRC